MPSLHRRILLAATAAAFIGAGAAPALAQIKGLEIIAPANPGSGFDQTSRAVRDVLTEAGLANPVQVVNVPGAGGTIGLAQLASGKQRGLAMITIGLTTVGAIVMNKPAVTLDDVEPVALLLKEFSVVVVPSSSDIKTLADLQAKVKADPSKVTWGVGSAGGLDHVIAGLIVKAVTGEAKKLNAINYAGGGEQVAAVLGGHVTAGIGGMPEFAPQIESGKMRALGVVSPERLAGSSIPTLKEQGIDVTLGTWRGLLTQKQASDADKKALGEALDKMAKTPAWKAALEKNGWTDAYAGPAGFKAFLAEQNATMKSALGDLGLIK